MRAAAPIVLALSVVLSSHSYAQDPAIEDAAMADRAVAQIQTTWAETKTMIDALRADESDEQNALRRVLGRVALPSGRSCSDQEMTTPERAIMLNLSGKLSAFNAALSSESAQREALSKQYNEANFSNAPYATRMSLYDKLVWSSARMKMLVNLHDSIFRGDVEVTEMELANTCTARRLLASHRVTSKDAADMLRTYVARREASEAATLARQNSFYSETLNFITGMP
jgi:hypothetical protein